MEKKLAIWLLQRHYARDIDEALAFATALEKGEFTEEMLEANKRNMDVIIDIGKVTEEKFKPYLFDKVSTAEKLIAFWAANPKDTNAIFFKKEYNEHFGEE